ncbi:MAG: LamG domain-containing protein, partial [Planctomycetota bacterium]
AHAGDGAIELDGWDDYVDLGEIEVAGDEVTFFGWFKADDWDCTDAPLIAKATGTAKNDHAWMLGTDQESGDVRLRFQLRADGVTRELVADGGNCEAGEWVFAAAVYDGERMRLYKDGVEVGSRRHSGTIGDAGGQWEEDGEGEEDGADALSEASAWIGGNPSGARQRPWDGCIDEVAICDRALTPQEIRALWRARLAEAEIIAYGDE